MTVGLPIFFQPLWLVCTRVHDNTLLQRKAAELWTHSFCFGPQRETLGVLDPYSDGCPREHNSKKFTYNRWCALPPKKAVATRSPYSLPKYMILDLPRDIIRSVARFRLRVRTLCFETATWNPRSSPACHLCEADDGVQDEQHVIPLHTPLYSVSLQEIWVLILINMSTGCFYLLFAPEQQQTPIFPA